MILSGKEFNSTNRYGELFKLLPYDWNCRGYQWKLGLNVLPEPFVPKGKCGPGGFYACYGGSVDFWRSCLDYKIIVRVTIPDDAQVVVDKRRDKIKTDKLFLVKEVYYIKIEYHKLIYWTWDDVYHRAEMTLGRPIVDKTIHLENDAKREICMAYQEKAILFFVGYIPPSMDFYKKFCRNWDARYFSCLPSDPRILEYCLLDLFQFSRISDPTKRLPPPWLVNEETRKKVMNPEAITRWIGFNIDKAHLFSKEQIGVFFQNVHRFPEIKPRSKEFWLMIRMQYPLPEVSRILHANHDMRGFPAGLNEWPDRSDLDIIKRDPALARILRNRAKAANVPWPRFL